VTTLTTGCANQYGTPEEAAKNACSALGPKALSGSLVGGAVGAAGGAAIGAAAAGGKGAGIGALVGLAAGLVAGAVSGNMLDRRDCEIAQAALQAAATAPIGHNERWANPSTGSSGLYTPVGAEYSANGTVCRPIRADYYMADRQPVLGESGVVCRSPLGDWARVRAVT
jgi:surface antigen